MWAGLLTDRIDNKSEKSNLINEHGLNREPVPLKFPCAPRHAFVHFCWQPFILLTCRLYINWAHSIMAALIIMTVLQNWCLPSEHNCLYLLASALFLLCALVNILSVQSYSTALIWVCPHFFYFDILLPGTYVVFFATWLAIWFSVEFGYSSALCVRGLATLPIV